MYKKIPVLSFSLLLTVFFFTACTKPDINFGQSYLDNPFTNIVYADSATPAISTIFIDSFITSATNKAVVGTYADPYFGTVTAQSYFPLNPPAFSDIYSKSIYDSLELILKLNKSYYGDTTQPLNLSVYELDETIQYAENKTTLFNTNSFKIKQVPLGSKVISIKPSVNDTVSIRLNDDFGKVLLEKLRTGDGNITSSAAFLNYFKGVRVSASSNPAYILGFSDSVTMRLHYHDPDIFVQNKNVNFTISDSRLQFNQILANRGSTALSGLNVAHPELLSSATGNMSFSQSATGALIKIRFPYIHDFFQIRQFVKVVRAELVIKPITSSFNSFYPLPPQLRLSQTSLDNSFGADITSSSTTTATVEYGNLSIDPLYGINTSYTYDVTNYIIAQMATTGYNENGLLLSPPAANYPSNLNRLVIGDKNNMNGNIQLKLYYLTVDK